MAIYRALVNLEKGEKVIVKGGFVLEHEWSAEIMRTLETMGKVSRVSAPPLAQLPGWKLRSDKLEKHGIIFADQFLEASESDLSKWLNAKAGVIEKWKQEVTILLTIPEPHG